MTRKKILRAVLAPVMLFCLAANSWIMVGASVAKAAGDPSLVIQPPKIELRMAPGQREKKTFTVINRGNVNVRLRLTIKDFRPIADSGKLEFYDKQDKGAATWLVPQFLSITLKPLQTKEISFIANVPQDMPSGSHLGAIMLEAQEGVKIGNEFGLLVPLTISTKKSPATVGGKIVNFSATKFGEGDPQELSLTMQNSGSAYLKTSGTIVFKNWLGQESGRFNTGELVVYPGATRTYKWQWSGASFIGFYTADIELGNPAAQGQTFGTNAWFIVFPWKAGLVVILALALAAFAVMKYRQRLPYKRWIGRAVHGLAGFPRNNLSQNRVDNNGRG